MATFNIRTDRGLDGRNSWWFRRGSTVEAIRSLDPDVCGLQEVRRLQLGFLRSELPEYGFLSLGRANGRGRGEHCPILYRHARFGVDEWTVRWFSENRSGRIATMARLVDRPSGARFGAVSTHLDHRSAVARTTGAAALAVWAKAWGCPTVLMGDFNATAVDASLGTLIVNGFADALGHLAPRGAGVATAHQFTGGADGARIDHIFVSRGFSVVESGINRQTPGGRLPSDHWPVYARLRFQGAETENVSQPAPR